MIGSHVPRQIVPLLPLENRCYAMRCILRKDTDLRINLHGALLVGLVSVRIMSLTFRNFFFNSLSILVCFIFGNRTLKAKDTIAHKL